LYVPFALTEPRGSSVLQLAVKGTGFPAASRPAAVKVTVPSAVPDHVGGLTSITARGPRVSKASVTSWRTGVTVVSAVERSNRSQRPGVPGASMRPATAGENAMLPEFKSMFQAGAITYAQPSVTKVGGVTQMRKVMALAEAFGVNVVPHSAYFGPGLLASIHCIAAMPEESLVERYDADFAVNPLHDAINPNANGRIAVPQGPGLGIDPDLAVIAKLRV